ncbi:hypothetical protein TRV_01670 [Trichophyton verrucosum HKI 0517]|uniref:Uncharacterized protein n=1 Tax=Trichophyton verrucosum (strain HKI 0517) TaxID=663202 RepID=D4D3L0_TRIVH|nr:uncharacterized protein TRV_01670 [Trichophyton verrucosum HKI 0517]EFE43560.1 hypothetical protein TRV_01670 [Trichophyton verrucosum HKI 0517]
MFDYLGIFYISDLLRKVKGWFQIPENYDKEVKWIDEMDETFNNHDFLLQESIFLRELFIERAIEGKLGQTVKPLYSGPKNWKEKLRDAGYQHWTIQKEMHERYLNQPDGPISRQYDISLSRKDQILANNPAKYLSQKRLVQLLLTCVGVREEIKVRTWSV